MFYRLLLFEIIALLINQSTLILFKDDCWKQRDGDYILEGYGPTIECYATLEEAKNKCLAAGDCKGIATQNNVCGGQFRVTHGGPTFLSYKKWKQYSLTKPIFNNSIFRQYSLRSYEFICKGN